MSDLRKRSGDGVRGLHNHDEGGGIPESRSTPVAWVFALVAMVACCGLPILIVAAGGLASISVVAGRYWLLFAGAAALVVAVAAVGIALRVSSRGRSGNQQNRNSEREDDYCQ